MNMIIILFVYYKGLKIGRKIKIGKSFSSKVPLRSSVRVPPLRLVVEKSFSLGKG